jgi:hypothetical protein
MLHLQAGIIYFLSGSVPSGSVQSGLQTNFITKFKKSLNKIVSSKCTNKTTDSALKTNNQTNPHPGSENCPDPKKIITDPQHSKRASYFHTNPHPGSENCPDPKKNITDQQHSKRASYFHTNPFQRT